MIARIWHGVVLASEGKEYLDLMRRIALPEYLATRGNRGGWCLYRTEGDVTHFEMLTFWDDADAIKRFAGDDYGLAKSYDFDPGYLIEMEARVGTTKCCRAQCLARVRHKDALAASGFEEFSHTSAHLAGGYHASNLAKGLRFGASVGAAMR